MVRVSQHEMACNKSGEKARRRKKAERVKWTTALGTTGKQALDPGSKHGGAPWAHSLRGCPVACPPPPPWGPSRGFYRTVVSTLVRSARVAWSGAAARLTVSLVGSAFSWDIDALRDSCTSWYPDRAAWYA